MLEIQWAVRCPLDRAGNWSLKNSEADSQKLKVSALKKETLIFKRKKISFYGTP